MQTQPGLHPIKGGTFFSSSSLPAQRCQTFGSFTAPGWLLDPCCLSSGRTRPGSPEPGLLNTLQEKRMYRILARRARHISEGSCPCLTHHVSPTRCPLSESSVETVLHQAFDSVPARKMETKQQEKRKPPKRTMNIFPSNAFHVKWIK